MHGSTSDGGLQTAFKQTQRPRAQRGCRDKRQSTLSEQDEAPPLPVLGDGVLQKPSAAHVWPATVQSLSSEHGVSELPVGVAVLPDVTVTKPLLGFAVC